MKAIAVYSSDYDPERLYQTGDVDRIDDDRVAVLVEYGDSPLDLFADTGENRILWSFRGERVTTAARTGYYIADFRTDGDLFGDFATELKRLHEESDWSFRYAGDPRWDAGFDLWRIEAAFPGLDEAQRRSLEDSIRQRGQPADDGENEKADAYEIGPVEQNEADAPVEGEAADEDEAEITAPGPPLVFGMSSYYHALQTLVAIYESDIDCTVAIGNEGDANGLADVDLLLQPGAAEDFEPRSEAARALGRRTDVVTGGAESGARHNPEPPVEAAERPSFMWGKLVGAVVLVLLALSLYSFVSRDPVHPITGLSTVGGLLGSLLAYPFFSRSLLGDRTDTDSASRRPVFDPSNGTWWAVIGLGTAAAFAFPTLFRIAGRVLDSSQWLFGTTTTMSGAAPSVALFITVLFGVNTTVVAVFAVRASTTGDRRRRYLSLVLAHVVYALAILIANGLAADVWSTFIPAN